LTPGASVLAVLRFYVEHDYPARLAVIKTADSLGVGEVFINPSPGKIRVIRIRECDDVPLRSAFVYTSSVRFQFRPHSAARQRRYFIF